MTSTIRRTYIQTDTSLDGGTSAIAQSTERVGTRYGKTDRQQRRRQDRIEELQNCEIRKRIACIAVLGDKWHPLCPGEIRRFFQKIYDRFPQIFCLLIDVQKFFVGVKFNRSGMRDGLPQSHGSLQRRGDHLNKGKKSKRRRSSESGIKTTCVCICLSVLPFEHPFDVQEMNPIRSIN